MLQRLRIAVALLGVLVASRPLHSARAEVSPPRSSDRAAAETHLVERLISLDTEAERLLAIAASGVAFGPARAHALDALVTLLRSRARGERTEEARYRELRAQLLDAIAALRAPAALYALLGSDLAVLDEEPERVEAALRALVAGETDGSFRAPSAVYAALPTALRVRLRRLSLDPLGEAFRVEDVLHPDWADVSWARDALLEALEQQDEVRARALSDVVLRLDRFDVIAAVVRAALPGGAGTLPLLRDYTAVRTRARGACLDPVVLLAFIEAAEARATPWATLALLDVLAAHGVTDEARRLLRVPGRASDARLEDARTALEALTSGRRDDSLPWRSAYLLEAIEVGSWSSGGGRDSRWGDVDEATAERLDALYDAGGFDDAVALAATVAELPASTLRSALRSLGPLYVEQAMPVFEAMTGEEKDIALGRLARERPWLFPPFARALFRAVGPGTTRVPVDARSLRAIAALEPHVMAWGDVGFSGRTVNGTDTVAKLLRAAMGADLPHESVARRLEELAAEAPDRHELLALAGVAYARAGREAEAARLRQELAQREPASARRLAIDHALHTGRGDVVGGGVLGPYSRRQSARELGASPGEHVAAIGLRIPSACRTTPGSLLAERERVGALSGLIEGAGLSREHRALLSRWLLDRVDDVSSQAFYAVSPTTRDPRLLCVVAAYHAAGFPEPSGFVPTDAMQVTATTCPVAIAREDGRAALHAVSEMIAVRGPAVASELLSAFLAATEGLPRDAAHARLLVGRSAALGILGRSADALGEARTLLGLGSLPTFRRYLFEAPAPVQLALRMLGVVTLHPAAEGIPPEALPVLSIPRDEVRDDELATLVRAAPESLRILEHALEAVLARPTAPWTALADALRQILPPLVADAYLPRDDLLLAALDALRERTLLASVCRALDAEHGEGFSEEVSESQRCAPWVRLRPPVTYAYDESYGY